MQILSPRLREAYHLVKAAEVVKRINTVVKEQHDPGKIVETEKNDNIKGMPQSGVNESTTDVTEPLADQMPTDPEFDTDQIISGTGSGPVMESRRNYN